jgi:hypothetical protein
MEWKGREGKGEQMDGKGKEERERGDGILYSKWAQLNSLQRIGIKVEGH